MANTDCRQRALAAACAFLAPALALAQARLPTIFVGHNGNLEGSVAAVRVNCDGTLTFIDRVITGARNPNDPAVPGTNVYGLTISPNGRWLIASHATALTAAEQLSILSIDADGKLDLVGASWTDDSPLDVQWVTDEFVAVTRSNIDYNGRVILYRFDPEALTLVETDRETTGGFCTSLAVHPSRQFVFAQDSNARTITSLRVGGNGSLDIVNQVNVGYYPLGLGVSPTGTKIYAGGGISGDGHQVVGAEINPATGALSLLGNQPFYSPGTSPKQVVISPDNRLAIVAHGTDATARTFLLDDESGELAYTGHVFDVGIQGSLGTLAVMDDLLFITDNWDGPTGVYSFRLGADGGMAPNGPLLSTQGVAPLDIAVWHGQPECLEDIDGDGSVGQSDLGILLASFGRCAGEDGFIAAADLDRDCCVGQSDLGRVLALFGADCP